MEREVTLRAARPGDIETFLVLERESPEASQWSAEDYQQTLRHQSTLSLVAEDPAEERIEGFVLGQVAAGEMEILNFAVAPASRRRGLGRQLLQEALTQAAARGASRCWLEVRASNQAAMLFYQSQGFRELYRRPSYYSDPVEDAVVCARPIAAESG